MKRKNNPEKVAAARYEVECALVNFNDARANNNFVLRYRLRCATRFGEFLTKVEAFQKASGKSSAEYRRLAEMFERLSYLAEDNENSKQESADMQKELDNARNQLGRAQQQLVNATGRPLPMWAIPKKFW